MRRVAVIAVCIGALAAPASAWAHAALLQTVPSASGTVNTPPAQVALTFSEAVEPRFAIVSVTDALAAQQTAGPPTRSPADAHTLVVPLKRLREGWYLVYWRVISADGHPVRGAFTFAVGPNPGPAPQFVIPSISETAATPGLVAARWIVFLTVMGAVGLYMLRQLIARPMIRRVDGTTLRWVSIGYFATSVVALVAIPVYTVMSTAKFALRGTFDVGAVVPLIRVSAFGRGFIDFWICFALFVVAAAISIWLDRPEREQRSIAELLAVGGALLAAAAVLVVPALAGHAAQTAPRGVSVFLDWLHVASGAVWVGGLAGLLVVWRSLPVAKRVAGLLVSVPRFSNVAFFSVLALVGSGIVASIIHLPTLASLWETSYGKALLVKIAILLVAVALAAVNLLRTKPRLASAELGAGAAVLLRRLVTGETLLVTGAVAAAAVLASLPPPAAALAKAGGALARVGPGRVVRTVQRNGYTLRLRVDPNRAAVPNDFALEITRGGKPVRGADVTTTFAMLDMEMGQQAYHLAETSPGIYSHSAPALVMVGHWGLDFDVRPQGGTPFQFEIVDHATG